MVKCDYIGGIIDGEVRGERIPLDTAKSHNHNEFRGMYSGQNQTNWRYFGSSNTVMWNLPPELNSIELVGSYLQKRGIEQPIHKSMYKNLKESPQMSLQGKSAMADNVPLRNLKLEDVKGNIVFFRIDADESFFGKGFTLMYFMDSEESAQDMKNQKIPYLRVPTGTFNSGGNPITDIWKKKFQKSGTEHILGVLEGYSDENKIFINMLTIRPNYKRNRIGTMMLQVLKSEFPNAKITTSSATDQGQEFKNHHKIKESMFPKDFNRHAVGSCMGGAAIATSYLLSKGINNFKIIDGFVCFPKKYEKSDTDHWAAHTWIEFADGRKFDPTKKQWKVWGYDPDNGEVEYITNKRAHTFTPEQYVKLCRIQQGNMNEVREKDLKQRHLRPSALDKNHNIKWEMMTLDNIKASRSKAYRGYLYWKNKGNLEAMQLELDQYLIYDEELKLRLKDINQPMQESKIKTNVLKELIKMVINETNIFQTNLKFWWMDPNLQFHEVPFEHHREWAINYLKSKNYQVTEVTDIYKVMYRLGFVRVGKIRYNSTGDVVLSYQYKENSQISRVQKKELKDWAMEQGCKYLVDDNTHKEELLEESKLKEEMTYKQLLDLTTDDRIERSKSVKTKSLPISVEDGLESWNFRYKSSPQTTVTDKPFEGNIMFLKGEVQSNEDAMDLECKVDCSCPDYMYKFAYNNAAQKAGEVGPNSLNGAVNRRPKPAYDIGEGLCKHLAALSKNLQTKIHTTKKSNLFEALNEITKQGSFNIDY